PHRADARGRAEDVAKTQRDLARLNGLHPDAPNPDPGRRRQMPALFSGLLPLILIILLIAYSIRVLREYERAVVFMLGRFWKVKGPGLILVIPFLQQMVRMDLRTRVLDVPPQDVISKDNVSVRVNAVVYFRVIDPEKAVIQVERFEEATSQLA